MLQDAKNILLRLRIVGPDHNNAFESYLTDGLCEAPACKLVGDGRSDIMPEQLEILSGINRYTQIELLMHGHVVKVQSTINPSRQYMLGFDVSNNSKSFYPHSHSDYFLKILNKLTVDPIQIYAPTCHGGAIDSSIAVLKPGSTIISYTEPEDVKTTVQQSIAREPLAPDLSPAEKFLYFIRKATITTSFSMKLENESIFKYTYRPFDCKQDTLAQSKECVKQAEIKFSKEYGAATGITLNADLEPISLDQIQEKLTDYINYLIHIKKFLTEEYRPLLKVAVKSQLSISVDGGNKCDPILHQVISQKNILLAKTVIEFGADVNEIGKGSSSSPLAIAFDNDALDIVPELLKGGANPNVVIRPFPGGRPVTPLTYAIAHQDLSLFQLLLSCKADPDFKAEAWHDRGPLWNAIFFRNLEMVNLLLTHGAKIESEFMQAAVESGDLNIVKALLDHGAVPMENFREKYHSKPAVVSLLDQYVVKTDDNNDNVGSKYQFESGDDQNSYDVKQKNISDKVVKPVLRKLDIDQFLGFVQANALDAVEDILKFDLIDVSAQDKDGLSALHMAVHHGHPTMVNLLLNYGAQVDSQAHGQTPLVMMAVRCGVVGHSAGIVKTLLDHGAEPTKAFNRLNSPGWSTCPSVKVLLKTAVESKQNENVYTDGYSSNHDVHLLGDSVHEKL